ncbi:MAG: DUF2202 domain-containing protein [Caldiserica bacterium]|nr:DUF2202 domain-containing protein [Caldisericota bacterium]
MKRILVAVLTVAVLVGSGAGVVSAYAGARRTAPATSCTAIADLPVEALSQAEKDALVTTLQEEYLARDMYQAIIAKLGSTRPFTNILKSGEQHVAALTALFTKYQLTVPADTQAARTSTLMAGITTVEDALKLGVTVEKEDIALYEELAKVVDNQDILQVFGNLKAASIDRHLPAFENALAGGTGIGQGAGRGGRGVGQGSRGDGFGQGMRGFGTGSCIAG